MIIYGVGLLALCTLVGVIIGDALGVLLGVPSNVGGVGIAMILLICIRLWMDKRGLMHVDTEKGVVFWGMMYIPVVVAMAAQQNVVSAITSGHMAVLAAIFSVAVCTVTIAALSRYKKGTPLPKEEISTLTSVGGKAHG
ncbi:malonate transporter, MadL subunit [Acinetobacter colistiniresistens]|uniref:Malonate transporter, MadL subunit n=1 Tax=Acinetobacter colistiniresistens TaxID=280145 RepID=N9PQ21_9GAMM|nr:malonate transporter subunit MadL [Acinetobacter colistiniresistens]ENX35639.1 malonate transporter, MadL subunit [Acinetobacter colistiniresistens]UUM26583.1 malonate transporter subunit MadL [Acinetobacter colistiniresistens]